MIAPEVMAAWMMSKLDEAWPLHVHHHRPHPKCVWCVIVFRHERDYRDDVEFALANTGALS